MTRISAREDDMAKEADTATETEDPYKAKEYHVIPGSEIHAPDEIKGEKIYTIKSGDNLSDIAKEQLGDANRWKEIYALNKDVIGDDPDLIHPGTKLKLPD
jgi:nucleoid-associated protein YgaU